MKTIYLVIASLSLLCSSISTFQVRHRHKNKGGKPLFRKIKKTEMLRLRQKKLYALEKAIIRRRDSKSQKAPLLSRKLTDGVNLSSKQQKGRELYLKKQNKPRNAHVKNTFVLRENQSMNIQGNIKKMKSSHKYKRHSRNRLHKNKIIKRYLSSKINKKFSLDYRRHDRQLLEAKEKKKVKPEADSQLKFTKTKGSGVSGLNGGITYVEREKMTKPMYLNMSPIYDYRGY